MTCLGNFIWLIFGGFINFISWSFVGILWCLTIIGIPIGMQCFKMANLSLHPFGRKINYKGKFTATLINIIWFFFGGIELALVHLISACALAITIIGIPFAIQQVKFARLALLPFGSEIRRK